MSTSSAPPCTAFNGTRLLAAGRLTEVAVAVKAAAERQVAGPLLVFNDATGRVVDLDLRGSAADVVARLSPDATPPRGRGRPKLGVVPREVTLLPRHWEWLAAQPGGASVTLRKLVEEARRSHSARDKARAAQEAAYRVMTTLAGNMPGYEEAIRALFAGDRAGLARRIGRWPKDLRTYVSRLAFDAAPDQSTGR